MSLEAIRLTIASVPVEFFRYMENGRLRRRPPARHGGGGSCEGRFNYGERFYDDVVVTESDHEDEDASDGSNSAGKFCFVKWWLLDDQKVKQKIAKADDEVQRRNQSRIRITESLKEKRCDRADIVSQLRSLEQEHEQFNIVLNYEQHQDTGHPDQDSDNVCRGNEEELDELEMQISSLYFRLQHEMISLAEERDIVREIKELEGIRERYVAYAAMRAWIRESLISGVNLHGVRKEQEAIETKIRYLKEDLETVESEIKALQDELGDAILKRDKAYAKIQRYRRQRDDGNAVFYENLELLSSAKDIASLKDVRRLEELSHSQVEQFFANWIGDRSFREDYEKRIMRSLEIRRLSRDGRRRSPNDELPEAEVPLMTSKESINLDQMEIQEETSYSRVANWEILSDRDADDVAVDVAVEVAIERVTGSESEVDDVKLKEMKREEEIAKAKKAMERKKKLAEKNAAKAAKKAQIEAEKKLKEREKKARKKTASTTSDEPMEEAAETENISVEKSVSTNFTRKFQSRRRNRPKGSGSVPKAILKRRRPMNPWVSACFTVLFIASLVLLGYYRYLLLQL